MAHYSTNVSLVRDGSKTALTPLKWDVCITPEKQTSVSYAADLRCRRLLRWSEANPADICSAIATLSRAQAMTDPDRLPAPQRYLAIAAL
jgi:hypothetical protein